MEVEEYLGRSQLFWRLKCGVHGQLVERYAVRLIEKTLRAVIGAGSIVSNGRNGCRSKARPREA